jgi:arabinogalactan oligomer/maltooligosaccharide transport system permease protein
MSDQKITDRKANARRRLASRQEGGVPSVHGTVIKIAVLAIIDAISLFVAMVMIGHHSGQDNHPNPQYGYAVVTILVTLILNWLYLRRGGLAAKYLAPGVMLLLAFQVSIVFYSGYIAFTNYSSPHNGSQSDAAVSIKLSAIVPDDTAPFMSALIVKDNATGQLEILATDLTTQPGVGHYYIGGADFATLPWHEITTDPGVVTSIVMNPATLQNELVATGFAGTKVLSLAEQSKIQAQLSTLKVPVSANEADGFMALDSSATGAQLNHYDALYNAKNDTFTRQSDGKVFFANQTTGFYQAKDGEHLSETGWRVEVGFKNFATIFGGSKAAQQLRGALASVLGWTFTFAIASVLSTFILGLALTFLFNDERMRGRKIYRSIMILPYAFPAFLSAYVWKGMYNTDNGFINLSILGFKPGHGIPWLDEVGPARAAILIANLWLGFPYMFLITTGALQAIPAELGESATIDGATAWQQFRLIKLPLLLVSLAPLLISSFAFNFNNFTIIYLLTGGGPTGDVTMAVPPGGTDILISYVYRIAGFNSGGSPVGSDYGLASAFSILIFIVVGGLSMISFRRTKFLEELN